MDEAGKTHARDVPGGTEYAFEVPDGFCAVAVLVSVTMISIIDIRFGVDPIQEPTPILLCEYPRKPPRLLLQWLRILDLNDEHVAWFRRLDVKGASEVVDACEVDVADVVCGVVVADLA